MKIKPIEWSEEKESTKEINYNHVIGTTPIGKFVITWKGWKDHPSYDVESSPFNNDLFSSQDSLEFAKEICEDRFKNAIKDCIEDFEDED